MRAIELFAGIGGFRIALNRIGVETVWANELRPLSARVYSSNFEHSNMHIGDIKAVDTENIPNFDLLTAGFPCQPFSSAGKKRGVRCEINGTLFSEIVRILNEKRPKYFILENVKRILTMEDGFHFKTILSELSKMAYTIEWRLIDAVNFGVAQSRQRVFIVGTLKDGAGSLSENVRLLDSDDAFIKRAGRLALRTLLTPIDELAGKPRSWGICSGGRVLTQEMPQPPRNSPSLKLKDILQNQEDVDEIFDFTDDTKERIVNSTYVNKYFNGVQILWNQKGGARFGYTVFGVEGNASTLTASTSRHYERYQIGSKFRRLTNVEYARLMGFPDDWCREASRYDQYSLFGNAVVPNCVEWVARRVISGAMARENANPVEFKLSA